MKYKVKAGAEFKDFKVSVEVEKTNPLHDWKVLSVVAVFLLLLSSGAYAAYSGNTSVLEKFLDAVVKVTEVCRKG